PKRSLKLREELPPEGGTPTTTEKNNGCSDSHPLLRLR
ncbi:MAG: hypothetical protein ACI8W8_004752, partial [Rhodothermales bacterium]